VTAVDFTFAPEVSIETRAADAQHLRRPHAVSSTHFQHAPYVLSADFSQWRRPPCFPGLLTPRCLIHLARQVINVDEVACCRPHRARNHVLQFAHIARPPVLQQSGLRAPRQTLDPFVMFLVVLLHKKRYQQGKCPRRSAPEFPPDLTSPPSRSPAASAFLEAPRSWTCYGPPHRLSTTPPLAALARLIALRLFGPWGSIEARDMPDCPLVGAEASKVNTWRRQTGRRAEVAANVLFPGVRKQGFLSTARKSPLRSAGSGQGRSRRSSNSTRPHAGAFQTRTGAIETTTKTEFSS
jgi:hypothetical protein